MRKLLLFDKIVIALLIISLVLFAYIFFRKTSPITVTLKVGETNVLYEPWRMETGTRMWFSQLFTPGMKEQDGLGRSMAEIVSVNAYDTSPDKKAVYVTVKLSTVYSRASNQYTFKGTPLLIGSTVKLNLDRILVEGLITHIEGVTDPRESVTLKVTAQLMQENPIIFPDTYGVPDYLASNLVNGQKITNSIGDPIITLINKTVRPATKVVQTPDGRLISQPHPLLKEVILELEVKSQKIAGQYFLFDDIPISIGEVLPLHFPHQSISPIVTAISPVN